TLLAHAGGGYITDTASCVPAKTDAQGIGAATTYLRRYAAASMVGIHQEDDDGEAAAHGGKPAPTSRVGQPMDGVWESLDDAQRTEATQAATIIAEYAEAEDYAGAHEYVEGKGWGAEMKAAVWSLLPSETRTALKRLTTARRAVA
ncbi:MAG: ERF family protein, partial [Patescibacteria group bacterium]|nr:ERF family protein [Patescibacteria group bacterium]